jgi:predicted nucleic acid-binding protein
LYAGLRHPGVFAKPFSAAVAARRVAFLRDESGFSFCCYELRTWPMILAGLSTAAFPRRRTYDHVLAVTLRSNGVNEFYTRNVADFREAGFRRIVNPID